MLALRYSLHFVDQRVLHRPTTQLEQLKNVQASDHLAIPEASRKVFVLLLNVEQYILLAVLKMRQTTRLLTIVDKLSTNLISLKNILFIVHSLLF